MQELSISLIRERFIIQDKKLNLGDEKHSVTALSNRIFLELKNNKGELVESYAIRAQNMHSCIRMAARIVQTFNQTGPLASRAKAFDWDGAWDSIINDYEYAFNPQRWGAVYHEGDLIFSKGEHNPLLDLIEKCDADHDGSYDDSIPMAEKTFNKGAAKIDIEYDGNIALVVNLEKSQGRCGIILRGVDQTRTFNFSAAAPEGKSLNFAQCITASAAFLEGIQLAFQVGMDNIKICWGIVPRLSKEEKQNREAQKRLSRLSAEITNLENAFTVRYRPERPEFHQIVLSAEDLAKGMYNRRGEREDT